jgi:hypothetical protein
MGAFPESGQRLTSGDWTETYWIVDRFFEQRQKNSGNAARDSKVGCGKPERRFCQAFAGQGDAETGSEDDLMPERQTQAATRR